LPDKEVAPLDYARYELIKYEHSHGQGDWHRMEQVDDPSLHDSEREWSRHRIFRCALCEDEIRVEMSEPEGMSRR